MQDFATNRTMMVDTQIRPSDVTKFPIIDAMSKIKREAYVPAGKQQVAYVGEALDVGDGRYMLEPRVFAKMLDVLKVGKDDLVLDVGCALGYSAAVLAHMAEAVVAIENTQTISNDAQSILAEQGVDNAVVVEGPLERGAAQHGPYDIIIVQGGVEMIPSGLLDQLKDGGRIAALFMADALGECRVGYKQDGAVTWRFAFNATAPILNGFEKSQNFKL